MLNAVDKQFHALYQNLIANGHVKGDRTGHGTVMLPAQMLRLDCTDAKLPILSTRFIPTKAFRREMLWFVSGKSSIKYLRDHKVGVWDSWFIPGSDKYDEPVTEYLTVEERLKTKEALAQWEAIDAKLDAMLATATTFGSAHLELSIPNGQVLEYNNLSRDTYVEFSKWLDTKGIPTTSTPEFIEQTLDNRLTAAYAANKGREIYEFLLTLPPSEKPAWFTIRIQLEGDEVVIVSIGKEYRDVLDQFITDLGIPTKIKNGGEKISLQRRLNRVSKNDTAKWDAINKASIRDPMVDWDGETYPVTVFKNGKFQDVTWDYGQFINVTKVLDDMKVPAYELLDADIGAGGYGPNWRTWQDTQLIDVSQMDAFKQQGYKYVTEVTEGDEDAFYGQVVMHREIDQLQNAIDMLKSNPDDRRMLVTAWNPGRTWQAALPPCHLYFQFVSWVKTTVELEAVIRKSGLHGNYLRESIHADVPGPDNDAWFHEYAYNFCVKNGLITRNLTLFVLLRSSDAPLGLVFNTAQYAYLLHMVGHVVNMDPHELITVGVDSHLYSNQIEPIKELLTRDSHPECNPRVVFNRKVDNIDDFKFEDVDIVGYASQPKIDIPVAV